MFPLPLTPVSGFMHLAIVFIIIHCPHLYYLLAYFVGKILTKFGHSLHLALGANSDTVAVVAGGGGTFFLSLLVHFFLVVVHLVSFDWR